VESGQAVQKLRRRVPGPFHHRAIDLVRPHQVDPPFPLALRVAHRQPHIGVNEVDARNSLADVVGQRNPRTAVFRDPAGIVHHILLRPGVLRSQQADIHAHLRGPDQQRIPHVATGIADKTE